MPRRPGDSAYLATLKIGLVRGRPFNTADVEGAPPVALMNEQLARQLFPRTDKAGDDALGKRIRIGGPWMTIVGVVRDTRHIGPLREPMREIYVPFPQFRSTNLQPRALIVRTAGDYAGVVPEIQRAVAAVDRSQALVSVSSLEENLAEFIAPQRFDTTLMTLFAALGLALATVGTFGVVSLQVVQRTRELGVRMALGAQENDVLRLVLSEGLRTVTFGLLVGFAGAWMLSHYLRTLLFGIPATDPLTFVLVCVLALVTAGVACCLPARRASRLDPLAVLRQE